MRLVVYHAEAYHPNHSHAIYEQIWPRFMQAAHAQGYEVGQLTSLDGKLYADYALRYKIDPSQPMLSREICWVEYLRACDNREQHCLIEPDFLIRKRIPELAPGYDMMLLDRTGEVVQTSIRICRPSALPFYECVLDNYLQNVPVDRRAWCGDCDAHHLAMGLPRLGPIDKMPRNWGDLRIEIRDQHDYGNTWPKRSDAVCWHFKGTSKAKMR